MVKKISGKNQYSGVKHLDVNNVPITNTGDIANVLGQSIARNSSSENYRREFQKHKTSSERSALRFRMSENHYYNKRFSMMELRNSLNRAHDTAVGPDDIHYQIIKNIPDIGLLTLLNIFNTIWEKESFPDIWRKAIVIPIPKPGKDSTNPTNYRPIALTSCLCKTLEHMVNNRLVFYLESNQIITPFEQNLFCSSRNHILRSICPGGRRSSG